MRLINTKTLQFQEFSGGEIPYYGREIPYYAILSHTWGEEEVSFHDMTNSTGQGKSGFTKIKYTCDQAVKDRIDWAWVDTCCIDKSNSAELSEAINSMFQWYKDAAVCYAYLVDVNQLEPTQTWELFDKSRWFQRGWTLQELLAPQHLVFYDQNWTTLGDKLGLAERISTITGIDKMILESHNLDSANVGEKMSWASLRSTTRREDEAYCLFGIFGVNMPLIYGEGEKAFARLQEAIMAATDDPTLFGFGMRGERMSALPLKVWLADNDRLHGFLANRTQWFHHAHTLELIPGWPKFGSAAPSLSSRGVRIEVLLLQLKSSDYIIDDDDGQGPAEPMAVAVLGVRHKSWHGNVALGIVIHRWGENLYGRPTTLSAIRVPFKTDYSDLWPHLTIIYIKPRAVSLLHHEAGLTLETSLVEAFPDGSQLNTVITVPPAIYDPASSTVNWGQHMDGINLGLVYSYPKGHRFALLFTAERNARMEHVDLGRATGPEQVERPPSPTTPQSLQILQMPEFKLRNYLLDLAPGYKLDHPRFMGMRFFMDASLWLNHEESARIVYCVDNYHLRHPNCSQGKAKFPHIFAVATTVEDILMYAKTRKNAMKGPYARLRRLPAPSGGTSGTA